MLINDLEQNVLEINTALETKYGQKGKWAAWIICFSIAVIIAGILITLGQRASL